jgi:hypothetical protein
MKRGRPIKAHLALARQPLHSLTLQAPAIRGLSEEFRTLREGLSAAALSSIRRQGEILDEGRRLLQKVLYEDWLASMCVSLPTSHNYRRVFHLAKEDPAIYARCEDLAADKVYCLATVPKDARARVLDATLDGKCAADIGVSEFRALVRRVLGRPAPVQSEAVFASALPDRLDSAISALERALTMNPRAFAATRALILVKLERICPLSVRLSRNLSGGKGGVRKPPSLSSPTPPAPSSPMAPKPSPTSPQTSTFSPTPGQAAPLRAPTATSASTRPSAITRQSLRTRKRRR